MGSRRPARSESALLKDAMRADLEKQQKRFFVEAFGPDHPLVRIQGIRTSDAKTRASIRECAQSTREVAAAIAVGKAQMRSGGVSTTGKDSSSWDRVHRDADEFADALAEMRDVAEELRSVFTSSDSEEV
ncbi:M96 protein [Murid betaherpesvirus 1]|nr:M96 protein [Murid betaherpesvirus 1]AWV68349.1 M96 protein [Murid betaherpesvirus 1]